MYSPTEGKTGKERLKVVPFNATERKHVQEKALLNDLRTDVLDEAQFAVWLHAFLQQPEAWALKHAKVRRYLKETRTLDDFIATIRLCAALSSMYKLSTFLRTKELDEAYAQVQQVLSTGVNYARIGE